MQSYTEDCINSITASHKPGNTDPSMVNCSCLLLLLLLLLLLSTTDLLTVIG